MVMLKGKRHENSDVPGGREDRQEADPASQVRRDRSECLNGGAQVGVTACAGSAWLRLVRDGKETCRSVYLFGADQDQATDMPIALHRVRRRLRRLAAGLRYCLALALTCGVVRQIRQWSMRWKPHGCWLGAWCPERDSNSYAPFTEAADFKNCAPTAKPAFMRVSAGQASVRNKLCNAAGPNADLLTMVLTKNVRNALRSQATA